MLSRQSEESVLRKRNEFRGMTSDSSEDEEQDYYDYENENCLKTPVSDRIRLESTSVLYSKSMYPLSLGVRDDE